jgi:hypothetical protein
LRKCNKHVFERKRTCSVIEGSLHILCLLRNFRTLRTVSLTTSHLTSTILSSCDIAADITFGWGFPFISTICVGPCSIQIIFSKIDTTLYTTNIPRMQHLLTQKMYTLENSWRVSFSKTGACWRIHANAHTSGTHQHSLSNNFFKCLNIGQCFKSLLKINWTGWNKKRVKWSLYDWHNDCLLYNKVNMYTAIKKNHLGQCID